MSSSKSQDIINQTKQKTKRKKANAHNTKQTKPPSSTNFNQPPATIIHRCPSHSSLLDNTHRANPTNQVSIQRDLVKNPPKTTKSKQQANKKKGDGRGEPERAGRGDLDDPSRANTTSAMHFSDSLSNPDVPSCRVSAEAVPRLSPAPIPRPHRPQATPLQLSRLLNLMASAVVYSRDHRLIRMFSRGGSRNRTESMRIVCVRVCVGWTERKEKVVSSRPEHGEASQAS